MDGITVYDPGRTSERHTGNGAESTANTGLSGIHERPILR